MKKAIILLALALSVISLAGCASAPKTIPDNLSVSELVQKAQDSSDHYNDVAAIAYYKAAMDRFGALDESVLCMGEYEIGFIYFKQGRYAEAKPLFDSLLARYAKDTTESLPRRYLILAKKIAPQIEAKLAKNKK